MRAGRASAATISRERGFSILPMENWTQLLEAPHADAQAAEVPVADSIPVAAPEVQLVEEVAEQVTPGHDPEPGPRSVGAQQ